ncbi:hypothetical protein D3C73_687930 [compost metagenome]
MLSEKELKRLVDGECVYKDDWEKDIICAIASKHGIVIEHYSVNNWNKATHCLNEYGSDIVINFLLTTWDEDKDYYIVVVID